MQVYNTITERADQIGDAQGSLPMLLVDDKKTCFLIARLFHLIYDSTYFTELDRHIFPLTSF